MVFGIFGFKKAAAPEAAPATAPPQAVAPHKTLSFEEAFALQVAAREAATGLAAPPAPAVALPGEPVTALPAATPPAPLQVHKAPERPAVADVPSAQIGTMTANRDDVIAAYKVFLRRPPENQMVIDSRVGSSREKILVNFMTAKEFLRYPENIILILQVAKAMEAQGSDSTKEIKP
jgi:hypothetical protein